MTPEQRRTYERNRYANDAAHRERMKEYARSFYQAHKEELRAKSRERMAQRRIVAGDAVRAAARERTRRYRADPIKSAQRRERDQAGHRRRTYQLTSEQYDQLFREQRGCCAICARSGRPLVVDHDHATNAVRGLLCHLCNTAIGQFNDDPALLGAAIAYLKEAA